MNFALKSIFYPPAWLTFSSSCGNYRENACPLVDPCTVSFLAGGVTDEVVVCAWTVHKSCKLGWWLAEAGYDLQPPDLHSDLTVNAERLAT